MLLQFSNNPAAKFQVQHFEYIGYLYQQAKLLGETISVIDSLQKLDKIFTDEFLLNSSVLARWLEDKRDDSFIVSDNKTKLYILGLIARKRRKGESELVAVKRLTEDGKTPIGIAVRGKVRNGLAFTFFVVSILLSLLVSLGLGALVLLKGVFKKDNVLYKKFNIYLGCGLLVITLLSIASAIALPDNWIIPIICLLFAIGFVLGIVATGGKKWDTADNEKVGYKNYHQRKKEEKKDKE